MTDFEKTKAELHKLVDGLDEVKCDEIRCDLYTEMRQIKRVRQDLKQLQKEPTLEDKLQGLGFKSWDKEDLSNNDLYYVYHKDIIDIITSIAVRSDEHIDHRLYVRDWDDNKILKCAKFLKELRDE